VEAYTKAQGIFRTDATPDPVFTDTLELDLSTVVPSLAGPKRPQDRIALTAMKSSYNEAFKAERERQHAAQNGGKVPGSPAAAMVAEGGAATMVDLTPSRVSTT